MMVFFPSTSELVPAYLLSQQLGPVAGVLGGVLTGHVARGEDTLAEFPGILRDVGLIIHYPACISQHICIWGQRKKEKKTRVEIIVLLHLQEMQISCTSFVFQLSFT